MRTLAALVSVLAVSGCSIKQNVTPAAFVSTQAPQICMIPAQGLRQGFHTTYKQQLVNKGFEVRELQPSASPSECALSTRYVGNWSWDLALYMVYADITVFQQGRQIGQAKYDAKWGGARLDKFIDAEQKIIELTDQLFPQGAPIPASPSRPAGVLSAASSIEPGGLEPPSKEAYKQQQLQRLLEQDLPYEQYQERYRQIMAQ
jgi:hypothetical protein